MSPGMCHIPVEHSKPQSLNMISAWSLLLQAVSLIIILGGALIVSRLIHSLVSALSRPRVACGDVSAPLTASCRSAQA